MKDNECTAFLQLYLPQLRFRWTGFRKVNKQVCKRISRRIEELGLSGLYAYGDYLCHHPGERQVFESFCGITISRFYRDRRVFDILCSDILPGLARDILHGGGHELRCWSAGCCSGEEPYTLQIVWILRVLPALRAALPLRVIATDFNPDVLTRARTGVYQESSISDLPPEFIRQAFTRSEKFYTVEKVFKENVEFREQDIRIQLPDGYFHLILCRNLAFTYFEESLQREILDRIAERLSSGGYLVIGVHEALPEGAAGIEGYGDVPGIYKKLN